MRKFLDTFFFPLIIVIFGIGMIVAGVQRTQNHKNWIETAAEITRIESEYDSLDENYDYHVFVSYTVDGELYEKELGEYNSTYSEGKIISVRYNPENPQEIQAGTVTGIFMFFGFGAVAVIAGAVILIKKLR